MWWIEAGEPAALPDRFSQLALRLGLEPAGDPDELRAQVHDALRDVAGWLLVFDNADDVESIARWLPAAPLPVGIPGHVVVTTRRGGFAALGTVLDLDVLDLPAAVRLLGTRLPGLDPDVASGIAESLGRLPLALEQAAAYLDRTQMPSAQYLELLTTRITEMLTKGFMASRADATIATLWDLSLQKVQDREPSAVQLLDICAYLAPESIPEDLLTNHPDRLPEPLAHAAVDPLAFNETVAALVDYALVKRTPNGLQVHRLVQAAVQARHIGTLKVVDNDGSRRQISDTGSFRPLSTPEPWTTVLGLLRADLPGAVYGVPEDWPRWSVMLPHVLTVTGRVGDGAGSLPEQVANDVTGLLNRAGAYLMMRARPGEAQNLLRRATAIAEAANGPDHGEVATDLNTLALILRERGDASGARPLAERALTIDEATYGPDHLDVATDLNTLALILQDLGDAAGARPLLERAVAIDQAAYGPDHPTVATALSNLAAIRRQLGDAVEARFLAERALAIAEAVYGPDHPTAAAIALSNVAATLQDLGDAAGARPRTERALAIDEAVYGPDHPNIIDLRGRLASYGPAGNHDDRKGPGGDQG